MDWLSLLVGLALGVFGNLLTPSVRSALLQSWSLTKQGTNKLGTKGLRLRLDQLEIEYQKISALRDNHAELIATVMRSCMSAIMATWIAFVGYFVIQIVQLTGTEVPKYWYFGIGGIIGFGTRLLVSGFVAWTEVDKVRNFEGFKKDNLASQEKIKELLGNLTL
ncbi:hypothetical protein GCM10027046_20930 [Uliginosibacterium flavum]|uniref:DUF106 domain-containing protein n=1 Tax=Uliginosibacterium flavum TaxID=1396831 RepID=A0ABV2TQP1_9RHOO